MFQVTQISRLHRQGSVQSNTSSEASAAAAAAAAAAGAAQPRHHEIVSELSPEEIRWFYKREVEKDWTPFMGYDSLRIELRYRWVWNLHV